MPNEQMQQMTNGGLGGAGYAGQQTAAAHLWPDGTYRTTPSPPVDMVALRKWAFEQAGAHMGDSIDEGERMEIASKLVEFALTGKQPD